MEGDFEEIVSDKKSLPQLRDTSFISRAETQLLVSHLGLSLYFVATNGFFKKLQCVFLYRSEWVIDHWSDGQSIDSLVFLAQGALSASLYNQQMLPCPMLPCYTTNRMLVRVFFKLLYLILR